MAAEMPVLSVIVPVYNAASTLEQCVRSIQANQNVSLEIILVDDGSKDQSPQVCDRLAAEDPRLRVIHKENGGVGSARRAGTAAARGTYLTFVDSDDSIKENMYETMLALAEKHQADCVVCGSETFILPIPSRYAMSSAIRLSPATRISMSRLWCHCSPTTIRTHSECNAPGTSYTAPN